MHKYGSLNTDLQIFTGLISTNMDLSLKYSILCTVTNGVYQITRNGSTVQQIS